MIKDLNALSIDIKEKETEDRFGSAVVRFLSDERAIDLQFGHTDKSIYIAQISGLKNGELLGLTAAELANIATTFETYFKENTEACFRDVPDYVM